MKKTSKAISLTVAMFVISGKFGEIGSQVFVDSSPEVKKSRSIQHDYKTN